MDGFEVVGLSRGEFGWEVEGRGAAPVNMLVSKLRALTGDMR